MTAPSYSTHKQQETLVNNYTLERENSAQRLLPHFTVETRSSAQRLLPTFTVETTRNTLPSIGQYGQPSVTNDCVKVHHLLY